MRLTPPTYSTFLISLLIAILSVAAQFIPKVAVSIPFSAYWVLIAAYLVLMLGNLVKGF